MKNLTKVLTAFFLISLFFVYGCDKNPAAPEEQELSNTQKMVVVATELAEPTGGVATDLNSAYQVAKGEIGTLYKTVSFDTTISIDWVTYQLSLDFYAKNGSSQSRFVPYVTDSVVYVGAASGHTSSTTPTQDITLERNSSFQIGDILSNVVKINGNATNNSDYKVTYSSSIFQIKPTSTFKFQNLKINLSGGDYIPTSGKILATIKGHISISGSNENLDTDYNFDITLEFIGNDEVKVTLPNGVAFILNLKTGKFRLA